MKRVWMNWLMVAIAGTALLAAGCSGQDSSKSQSQSSSTPTGTAALTMSASAPGAYAVTSTARTGLSAGFSPMAVQVSQTPDVQLTDFAVAVEKVKFKREDQAAGAPELEIEFSGPYFIDLLNATGQPLSQQIGSVTVPAGTYDGILFSLHKAAAADTPPAILLDHTVYAAGTLNASTAFTIDHDLSEEVTVTGPNGIVIDSTGANSLIVNLNLMGVFTTPVGGTSVIDDLNTYATANPGVNPIVVSPQSSVAALKDLSDKFKEALKISTDFGEDSNGDGDLDTSEDVE